MMTPTMSPRLRWGIQFHHRELVGVVLSRCGGRRTRSARSLTVQSPWGSSAKIVALGIFVLIVVVVAIVALAPPFGVACGFVAAIATMVAADLGVAGSS